MTHCLGVFLYYGWAVVYNGGLVWCCLIQLGGVMCVGGEEVVF